MIKSQKHKLKEFIYRRYNISFSKSGDDIQLRKLINNSNPGVYVDIGCWDPVKASNTYYFSLRKWKGICIDPNPELVTEFKRKRPLDIFINKGISAQKGEFLDYYMLDDDHKSSMNTFDKSFLESLGLENKITKTIKVPTIRLEDVLAQYITDGDRLDFFDVDVEGYDLEVLQTNNWDKYRPKIIMIESHTLLKNDMRSEITEYLETKHYSLLGKSLIHKTLGNLFYIDDYQ